ncbi:MAG: ABC transporter permease [Clostridium sp.]
MRNIILVLKNNFKRLVKDKVFLFLGIIVLPIIVALGIYFSGNNEIKGKIAVVGGNEVIENSLTSALGENSNITFEFLEESPTKTDLIKGIYLAQVDFSMEEVEVVAYGKPEVKETIESIITETPYTGTKSEVTIEGKIIGFLVMFLLMGSTMLLENFLTDRESGVYVRVLNGGLSYFQYMIGQLLFIVCTFILDAAVLTLLVIKLFGVTLNISLLLFTMILILLGIFAATYGLFISTIIKNKVTVNIGSSVIVLVTSLLGGCLVNINDSNKIMEFIRNLIPQKRLINLANSFNYSDLVYILIVILLFILGSFILGKRQYERGDFL